MSETTGQTTTETEGSAAASTSVLGGAGSQEGQSASWIESLDQSYRTDPTISGIQAETMPEALNAMAKMTQNAQKLVGVEKWPALKAGATPEETRAWKSQHLGAPATREEYLPFKEYQTGIDEAGEPQLLAISEEDSALALDVAHELGLNQADAQKLAGTYAQKLQEAKVSNDKLLEDKLVNDMAGLRSELGNNYQVTLDSAESALNRLASQDLRTMLGNYPEITNNPEFIKIFAEVGLQMQSDRSVNGGRPPEPGNPVQAKAMIDEINRSPDYAKVLNGTSDPATATHLNGKMDSLYKIAYPGTR